MTFGEKLYALRRQAGFSQEELAEKLNVTRQAVSRWESGSVLPDAPNLLQLGRLFRVSIDYLLKDELTEASPTAGAQPPDQPAGTSFGDAPSSGQAVPPGGSTASSRRPPFSLASFRYVALGLQAVGFLLVSHALFRQDDRAFYVFLLFNVGSILLFELASHLLPVGEAGRTVQQLRFYRAAVWCFAWYPLSLLTELFWNFFPRPHSALAQPVSTLVLYLFLCGGIAYAARREQTP